MTATDDLVYALALSLAWCDINAIVPPRKLLMDCASAIKTVRFYARALRRLVSDFYDGEIDRDAFVDGQAGLVEQQLRRAWNEGMRVNGLDPESEMTPRLEKEYQEIVAEEWTYIDNFADAVERAAQEKAGLTALYRRVDLWANRYKDVVNRAVLATAETTQLYEWVYGDTISHCADCERQAGQVRTARGWRIMRKRGIYPQSRKLECGGYNCDCQFRKVAKKKDRQK